MGLSSDFFIQGAPSISAAAAGVSVEELISASIPLWAVMSVTAVGLSFFMMKRELKKGVGKDAVEITLEYDEVEITRPGLAKGLTALIILTFAAIIVAMAALTLWAGMPLP